MHRPKRTPDLTQPLKSNLPFRFRSVVVSLKSIPPFDGRSEGAAGAEVAKHDARELWSNSIERVDRPTEGQEVNAVYADDHR